MTSNCRKLARSFSSSSQTAIRRPSSSFIPHLSFPANRPFNFCFALFAQELSIYQSIQQDKGKLADQQAGRTFSVKDKQDGRDQKTNKQR
ncbi:hypothetical protein [uncultured Lactobacillus sp.]|uniref:hypothetical protein n=1 Tax=uncultured Lactobacillus sp. TaxID=153152 RepID=UPI002593642B|nr:hypothetical protein [uncultured Lactobacillus sp.]